MYNLPGICKRCRTVLSKHGKIPGCSNNARSLYFLEGLVGACPKSEGYNPLFFAKVAVIKQVSLLFYTDRESSGTGKQSQLRRIERNEHVIF